MEVRCAATGNANYAWFQHMLHHLEPNGVMNSVLAIASLNSNTSNVDVIRTVIVKDYVLDFISMY